MKRLLRIWRFRYAVWRFNRELPEEWKRMSEEEQAAEIRDLVRQVRAERAARVTDSATVTETEIALP